jgi:hypothetical protein
LATQYEVLVNLNPEMPLKTVSASGGYVPPDAIRAGTDDDGAPLFLCSAEFAGGFHPGKLKRAFKACDISYEGKEQPIPTYTVVTPAWATVPIAWGDDYLTYDFPAGVDIDGQPLYICRAYFGGGIHPGKTKSSWTTCHIGWAGKEEPAANYDIMSSLGWLK